MQITEEFSSASPRFGMCCDMVDNFEVVLADGRIINVNANANSDLWTVLKGGSNNFGIVTRLDMRTFPQGKQWAGIVIYLISTLDENFKALASMENTWDPYASMKLSITFSTQTKFTIASNFEYTKEDGAPAVFKSFMDIKPQYRNTMKIATLSETPETPRKCKPMEFAGSLLLRPFNFLLPICKTSAVASVEDIKGMRWTLTYWRLHSSTTNKSAAHGGNSTGLDTSQGSLVLCILTYSWVDASDDACMDGAAKYGYGDEMKSSLQAVSKKYDPEGFFQTVVPGGFKISI
ncbi:hypothetical protein EAF04_000231 [Stromatinia cepivora]|nr:hypothetical protein EAF04_000231 [Stromatinia cepivora]